MPAPVAGVPAPVIQANRVVVDDMSTAHQALTAARGALVEGADAGPALEQLRTASQAMADITDGLAGLVGSGTNLLEDSFHRYAVHGSRGTASALGTLERGGAIEDYQVGLAGRALDDAISGSRLAVEAGERSLDPARIERRIERMGTPFRDGPGSSRGSGSGSSGSSSGTWTGADGQSFDGLGNPVSGGRRGGDVWTGPDGQSFDGMGNPVSGGRGGSSFSGPDGTYEYSGI